MSAFRVGQKVVCIDASIGWTGLPNGLVERAVYTVRKIVPANPDWTHNADQPALHLMEVFSARPEGFRESRFRPLVQPRAKSQSEDVALFTGALTKVGEQA